MNQDKEPPLLDFYLSNLVLLENWYCEAVELITAISALSPLVAPLFHAHTAAIHTVELVGGTCRQGKSLFLWTG